MKTIILKVNSISKYKVSESLKSLGTVSYYVSRPSAVLKLIREKPPKKLDHNL